MSVPNVKDELFSVFRRFSAPAEDEVRDESRPSDIESGTLDRSPSLWDQPTMVSQVMPTISGAYLGWRRHLAF